MTQPSHLAKLWRVFVEDFASREAHRRIGEFDSYEKALAAAMQRVENGLAEFLAPAQSAQALFEMWAMFGEDVFIVPDDPSNPFSAMDYARQCSQRLTNRNGKD